MAKLFPIINFNGTLKSLGVQGDVTKVNWLGILNTPWTSLYLISRCDVPWLCGLNLL